ncbi:MAG: hypothetical protein WKG07_33760 [Hymenobacter sp.]
MLTEYDGVIRKLGSISEVSFADAGPAGAVSFVLGGSEFLFPSKATSTWPPSAPASKKSWDTPAASATRCRKS